MIDADVRAAVVVVMAAADAEEGSVIDIAEDGSVIDIAADVCVTVDDDSAAALVEETVVCEVAGVVLVT